VTKGAVGGVENRVEKERREEKKAWFNRMLCSFRRRNHADVPTLLDDLSYNNHCMLWKSHYFSLSSSHSFTQNLNITYLK